MNPDSQDIDRTEWNRTAYYNGRFCEDFIKSFIPDFEWIGEEIDGKIGGTYAEIKSCQIRVLDNTPRGPYMRPGRFWFKDSQHKELVKKGGLYIFLVHEGERVISTRIIKASLLFPIFSGARTMQWNTIFNKFSVAPGAATPQALV